ncbi:hypothetical protein BDD12DRAFT_885202 [Trichophaea hybrida]|nr:hypothetical protein BDD12DRAFT_885202 [Trichophaea hybrida]
MEYAKRLFGLQPVAPTDPSPPDPLRAPPPPSTLRIASSVPVRKRPERSQRCLTSPMWCMFAPHPHLAKQLLPSYFTPTTWTEAFPPYWPILGSTPASPSPYRHILVQECHLAGYTDINLSTLSHTDIVLIFDEGQMSYGDQGLWLGFVKTQNRRREGPKIYIYTSYGSPSGGPSDFAEGTLLSFLGVNQRVSITVSPMGNSPRISLFYSRDEFDDVVRRLYADLRRPLPLHTDAKDCA